MTCIGCSDVDIAIGATRIRQGLLVSFPTETVYGLGANALDEEASRRIYAVKGRPPTDPLICHVPSIEKAVALWDQSTPELAKVAQLGLALGRVLWPGPITFVAKASAIVAPCVTGGSGCVGIRIPDHPVAQRFLEACGVPVAAPSANTFGHVSPTTAQHVMDDLASRDATLTVIDGGSSNIGIESTVVRLNLDCSIEILRRGKIGVSDIIKVLHSGDPLFHTVSVTVRDTRSKFKREDEVMDGPGQLLTHYSPSIPSFLLTPTSVPECLLAEEGAGSAEQRRSMEITASGKVFPLDGAVVIDFNGALQHLAPCVKAYRSLSKQGLVDEACRDVFDALRWVESVQGGVVAIFPLLSEWTTRRDGANEQQGDNELLAAVEDRLFRAASGVIASIDSKVGIDSSRSTA